MDRLSLGIPISECFGLLGINGAGKTTTFRMLTGDEIMSGGTALVEGFDIRTSMNRVSCIYSFSGSFFFSHRETKRDRKISGSGKNIFGTFRIIIVGIPKKSLARMNSVV